VSEKVVKLLDRPPLTDVKGRLQLLVDRLSPDVDTAVVIFRSRSGNYVQTYCYGEIANQYEQAGLMSHALFCFHQPDYEEADLPEKPAS
jgi:hypothetical protein